MITPKLRQLFLLSIPLFIVHGLEEYFAGFYNVYPLFNDTTREFNSIPQAVFFAHQLHWWILLVITYLLLLGGKWPLRVMTLLGFLFIYELIHIVEAIKLHRYFPGLYTSLLFPVVGLFFWRELIKNITRHE